MIKIILEQHGQMASYVLYMPLRHAEYTLLQSAEEQRQEINNISINFISV